MKWCSNTSYLFISYHYTYEVIMKCYEVLRCLFMHIINCICETYDGNMKCWGVHSYFHFCTYAQKSLHSSQEHFILLIICRLLAWRVYATLHISSRVFTTKSGFRFCKMLFPCFNAFQIVPIYVLLIAGCHLAVVWSVVKTCEELKQVFT